MKPWMNVDYARTKLVYANLYVYWLLSFGTGFLKDALSYIVLVNRSHGNQGCGVMRTPESNLISV
jgi:hypothetical protein